MRWRWWSRDERVRVRMGDGIAFIVSEGYRRFCRRWRRSMRRRHWITVYNAAGRKRILNPHQIVYVEQMGASDFGSTVASPTTEGEM